MNERNKRGDLFHFVGLQVADQMPFNIVRQQGLFSTHFLHLVFSENTLSSVIRFFDFFNRMSLAYSYQPANLTRQLILEKANIFSDFHCITCPTIITRIKLWRSSARCLKRGLNFVRTFIRNIPLRSISKNMN